MFKAIESKGMVGEKSEKGLEVLHVVCLRLLAHHPHNIIENL
jgi:hypothetical protein